MKFKFVDFIKRTSLYYSYYNFISRRHMLRSYADWVKRNKPAPPPHLAKQLVLRDYSKKYALKTLVETGTYLGDMVQALRNDFECIHSIELSLDLYEKARRRFKGVRNVQLIHGDSAIELERLMTSINRPTLFWLDGHYSEGFTAKGKKETPIFEELIHVFNAPDLGHVIVIDDARSFGTDADYPTIEELLAFIASRRSNVEVSICDDSIRITPKR